MHKAKRMAAEKEAVDNATFSSTYPTTKAESSNPTPLKKQKSEVEANVRQRALPTPEHCPAHNQSAEEVIDLDLLAQARIGSDVTKVPGDGWCFFHAVSRHCSNWKTWSTPQAAELYLQALEWLRSQKYGPKAEVKLACVPFDDRELELHKQYLMRAHKSNLRTADLTKSGDRDFEQASCCATEAAYRGLNPPWVFRRTVGARRDIRFSLPDLES